MLKQRRMYDNTVLLFSSDNGPEAETGASAFPLHGYFTQHEQPRHQG